MHLIGLHWAAEEQEVTAAAKNDHNKKDDEDFDFYNYTYLSIGHIFWKIKTVGK